MRNNKIIIENLWISTEIILFIFPLTPNHNFRVNYCISESPKIFSSTKCIVFNKNLAVFIEFISNEYSIDELVAKESDQSDANKIEGILLRISLVYQSF